MLTSLTLVTGGTRFGIMMALAKCAAVWGTTERMLSPSRTCRCQSSGVVIVTDVCTTAAAVAAAGVGLCAAAEGVLLIQRLLLLLPMQILAPELLSQLVEAARLPAGGRTSRVTCSQCPGNTKAAIFAMHAIAAAATHRSTWRLHKLVLFDPAC